jgi:hypothetical protein
MYLASAVEIDTQFYIFEGQHTRDHLRKWHVPELTCGPHDLQHNQNLSTQQDQTVRPQTMRPLDIISLVLGCQPNIKEFALQCGNAIHSEPLGIGHTYKC